MSLILFERIDCLYALVVSIVKSGDPGLTSSSFAVGPVPTGVPLFDGAMPAFMSVDKISDMPILEGPAIEGIGADVGGIDGTCSDLMALNDGWEKGVDCGYN